ncbi:unnamed protein product, partial [Gordionus sp. m RMFG-2023]
KPPKSLAETSYYKGSDLISNSKSMKILTTKLPGIFKYYIPLDNSNSLSPVYKLKEYDEFDGSDRYLTAEDMWQIRSKNLYPDPNLHPHSVNADIAWRQRFDDDSKYYLIEALKRHGMEGGIILKPREQESNFNSSSLALHQISLNGSRYKNSYNKKKKRRHEEKNYIFETTKNVNLESHLTSIFETNSFKSLIVKGNITPSLPSTKLPKFRPNISDQLSTFRWSTLTSLTWPTNVGVIINPISPLTYYPYMKTLYSLPSEDIPTESINRVNSHLHKDNQQAQLSIYLKIFLKNFEDKTFLRDLLTFLTSHKNFGQIRDLKIIKDYANSIVKAVTNNSLIFNVTNTTTIAKNLSCNLKSFSSKGKNDEYIEKNLIKDVKPESDEINDCQEKRPDKALETNPDFRAHTKFKASPAVANLFKRRRVEFNNIMFKRPSFYKLY